MFSSYWKPWGCTPPKGHSSQPVGTEATGTPPQLGGMIQLPECPCSALLAWAAGVRGSGIWGGVDETGASAFPEPLCLPSTGQEKSAGGSGGQRFSVGPPQSPLPAHSVWAQVWYETPPTSRDTLFPVGGAQGEGAGERAAKAAANFPVGRCLHPSDELALGFPACSPGQVCQEKLAGSCLAQGGIQCSGPAGFGHQNGQLEEDDSGPCLGPDV